jgi:hypothetical protein
VDLKEAVKLGYLMSLDLVGGLAGDTPNGINIKYYIMLGLQIVETGSFFIKEII